MEEAFFQSWQKSQSYLSLSFDITKKALAYLPLRDFQRHCSSYKERYLMRYGSTFPFIEGSSFVSDEDEYLFCAGYFHQEIGNNSEKFLPRVQCVNSAMAMDDVELLTHHIEADKLYGGSVLAFLVKHNCVAGMSKLRCHSVESLRVTTNNVDVIKALLKYHPSSVLFSLFRDWDNETAWKLYEKHYDIDHLDVFCGLQASSDIKKITQAQDLMELNFWSRDEPHVIAARTYALAYLDDVDFWAKIWKRYKRLLKSCLEEERANKIGLTLVCYLIWVGAINIIKWLRHTEGVSFFEGTILYDAEEWTVEHQDDYLNRDGAAECIEYLLQVQPSIQQDEYITMMYAAIGDRRVLECPLPTINALDCVVSLFNNGKLDLCLACYKLILAKEDGIVGAIDVSDKLFLYLMKSGVDVSQLDANMDTFSYEDWQQVVRYGLRNVKEKYIPTPALYQKIKGG